MARVRIGELLVTKGRIDEIQLRSALAHQRVWGGRIGQAMVALGFLSEPSMLEALAEQLDTRLVTVGDRPVARELLALLPERLMRRRKVVPLSKVGDRRRGTLVVAVTDPGDLALLDEIAFAAGLPVRAQLASEADIDRALERLIGDAGPTPRRHEPIELPEDTSPLTLLRRGQRQLLN